MYGMGDYRWGVSRACRDPPRIQIVAKYSITVKVMVALVDPSDWRVGFKGEREVLYTDSGLGGF